MMDIEKNIKNTAQSIQKEIISHASEIYKYNADIQIFRLTEKVMLISGTVLLISGIIALSYLWSYNITLFKYIMGIIIADFFGGRGASVFTGLEMKINPFVLTLLLFIFNLVLLLVSYPVIVSFYEHAIETKLFGKFLKSTREIATQYKSWIKKIGIFGLPLFVLLPLPYTGIIAGAVVGFLLGMSTPFIIGLLIPALFLDCFMWVYGFNYMAVFAGKTGKIISAVIVILLILYALLNRYSKFYHYYLETNKIISEPIKGLFNFLKKAIKGELYINKND